MSGKTFKIQGDDISDGYHTFEELYEHRCLLFILLCLTNKTLAYWREGFPGWPLLGLETGFGQITYHVPEKLLPLFEKEVTKGGSEWDGHTSKDVLKRLKLLCDLQNIKTRKV